MDDEEICLAIASNCEEMDVLIDMVMDRDNGDALNLVMMLHEITKLYVADQLPKSKSVVWNQYSGGPVLEESLEVVFAGRNVRTAKNMLRHLNVADVDDDGIPL